MAPERSEVRKWLVDLASGSTSREEAADAARTWVEEREAEVTDEALWNPLARLASADLQSAPSKYLYNLWDFETWLSDFELAVDFEREEAKSANSASEFDAMVRLKPDGSGESEPPDSRCQGDEESPFHGLR